MGRLGNPAQGSYKRSNRLSLLMLVMVRAQGGWFGLGGHFFGLWGGTRRESVREFHQLGGWASQSCRCKLELVTADCRIRGSAALLILAPR